MSQLNISKVYVLCTRITKMLIGLYFCGVSSHTDLIPSGDSCICCPLLTVSFWSGPDEMLTIDLSWSFQCHTVFIHSFLEAFPKWLSITLAFCFLVYRSFTHAQTKWPSPTPICQCDLPAEILSFHAPDSLTSLPSSSFSSHWFITTEHNTALPFGVSTCSGAFVGTGKAVLKMTIFSGQ